MKIQEWTKIHTEDSPNGLTVSELIEAYRASTCSEAHKAELTRELSGYIIAAGTDAKTNRQLRFPQTLDGVRGWILENTTYVSEGGDNPQHIAEMFCRTRRIEPNVDSIAAIVNQIKLLGHVNDDGQCRLKFNYTFGTWLAVNTTVVNDLTMGDPARKIAESFCRSQGLGYDAGTLTALCSELDRLHYVYGSQSFLKLANFIV